jgi:hypothetical protein
VGLLFLRWEEPVKFPTFKTSSVVPMVYYKLVFGIIFFCTFTVLMARTWKRSHYSFSYIVGRLEILLGIAAGLFLIITAFQR